MNLPAKANQPIEIERPEVELWDVDNSRSVLNLVPDKLKEAMLNFKQSEMDAYFSIDEGELKKLLKDQEKNITRADNRMRIRFWEEYNEAQNSGRKIKAKNFYSGVCTRSYYNQKFLHTPHKVAWLLTPPVDYVTALKDMLQIGLERERDVLEIDPFEKGKTDYKLIALQEAITRSVEDRVKGAVPIFSYIREEKTLINKNLPETKNHKDIEAEFDSLPDEESVEDVVVIDQHGEIK